jgi:hypothetical protein
MKAKSKIVVAQSVRLFHQGGMYYDILLGKQKIGELVLRNNTTRICLDGRFVRRLTNSIDWVNGSLPCRVSEQQALRHINNLIGEW